MSKKTTSQAADLKHLVVSADTHFRLRIKALESGQPLTSLVESILKNYLKGSKHV